MFKLKLDINIGVYTATGYNQSFMYLNYNNSGLPILQVHLVDSCTS